MKDLLAKRARRFSIGIILTLLAATEIFGPFKTRLSESLDRAIADQQARLQVVKPEPDIIIVDIDERSISELGRWPWSRSVITQLVEKILTQGGAKVLAFDVVFAEAQQDADLQLLDQLIKDPKFKDQADTLTKLRSERDPDAELLKAISGKPVVLGYYFTADRQGFTGGALPEPVMSTASLVSQGWRMTSWTGYGANLSQFTTQATSGFFSPRVDVDGIVRELPLLADYKGNVYESLVSAVLRLYLDNAALEFNSLGVTYRNGPRTVTLPLTPEMTALIPFAGMGGPNSGRFRYIAAADLVKGVQDPSILKGKIVLVGTTSLGLTDLRATPTSAAFPGVETHASLLAGALNGTIKTRPPGGQGLMALATLAIGLLMSFAMPRLGVIGVLSMAVLVGTSVLTWQTIALQQLGWFVPIATTLFLTALIALLNLIAGYFVEGKSRRAVVERFGEYVAPQLVAQMANDPQHYRMDGENKELTILFADIRGFTPMAEAMPPQILREFLNRFLGAMTDIVHRYNGTVDKYMGDAVMAFWGAPIDDATHAEHAVSAAIAMQEEIIQLNSEFAQRGWPVLQVGIGLNSGVVRVGDMGSVQRRAYTVIGDAVNVAARLESLSKVLETPIVVGHRTTQLANSFDFVSLGRHPIAGKTESVEAFRPKNSRNNKGASSAANFAANISPKTNSKVTASVGALQ